MAEALALYFEDEAEAGDWACARRRSIAPVDVDVDVRDEVLVNNRYQDFAVRNA